MGPNLDPKHITDEDIPGLFGCQAKQHDDGSATVVMMLGATTLQIGPYADRVEAQRKSELIYAALYGVVRHHAKPGSLKGQDKPVNRG